MLSMQDLFFFFDTWCPKILIEVLAQQPPTAALIVVF